MAHSQQCQTPDSDLLHCLPIHFRMDLDETDANNHTRAEQPSAAAATRLSAQSWGTVSSTLRTLAASECVGLVVFAVTLWGGCSNHDRSVNHNRGFVVQ